MKCSNCGAQLVERDDGYFYCEYCDSILSRQEALPQSSTDQPAREVIREVHHYHERKPDRLSFGMGCLSFMFFPLGWIIWYINRDSSPRKAKTALAIAATMTALMVLAIITGN